MALDCEMRAASTMRQESVTMMRSLRRDARKQKGKMKNRALETLSNFSFEVSEQIKTVFHLRMILDMRIV